MDDPKFRVGKFAEKIGITANHMWNIANYRYQGRVKDLLAIEDATSGFVVPWKQMLKCHEECEKNKPKTTRKDKNAYKI